KTPAASSGGPTGTSSNVGRPSSSKPGGNGQDTEETTKIEYVVPTTEQEIVDNKEEIQRLTIAALVDLSGEEKDGKSEPRMALAEAEELIKRAVGFKVGRDDIKVIQVRFANSAPGDMSDQDWITLQRWQTVATLVRQGSLGVAALAALAIGWMALRRTRAAVT